jgi:hypothetical protein
MLQYILRHPGQYKGCFDSLPQNEHVILKDNGACNALVKDNKGILNIPQLHLHISVV